jgi:hypothetical protein
LECGSLHDPCVVGAVLQTGANKEGKGMRALIIGSVTALGLAIAVPGYAGSYEQKSCSYFDGAKSILDNGSCIITDTAINNDFAYVVVFLSGRKVTIQYVASQGRWHRWLIDGKVGTGYEIDRDHLVGSTLDLNNAIEWSSDN